MTEHGKRSAFDADEVEALRAIGWRESPGASSCPDSSLLMAAEEGMLDEQATARVRGHVTKCAMCQQLQKDLAVLLTEDPAGDVSARIRSKIPAGNPIRRPRFHVWITAAGLAAAAALIWFFVQPEPSTLPAPDSQVARVTPPPIASVFVVSRPAIPPGDVELTVRGESSNVSLEDRISAALDKADNGDVAGASSDLQAIAGGNRTSRIAALALGAIQLKAARDADAVATLEGARVLKGEPETADEVGWFLGIALVRTGNLERARDILDDICKRGGSREKSACAGVAEIDRLKPRR